MKRKKGLVCSRFNFFSVGGQGAFSGAAHLTGQVRCEECFGRDSGARSLCSCWLSVTLFLLSFVTNASYKFLPQTFLAPAPSCFQPHSLTLTFLSVVPMTTLTVSPCQGSPRLHSRAHFSQPPWANISPSSPLHRTSGHGSPARPCSAHLGLFSRQTCSDYPVAALKSQAWSLPSPTALRGSRWRHVLCSLYPLWGTEVPPGTYRLQEAFQERGRAEAAPRSLYIPFPNLSPSPFNYSPFLSCINRAGLGQDSEGGDAILPTITFSYVPSPALPFGASSFPPSSSHHLAFFLAQPALI